MTDNPIRTRLAQGDDLFGVFTMFAEPALVEIAGLAGFDFAILDTEHGPAGHEALQNCLRAADATGLPCLVRVPQHTPGDVQRALDSGAAGIIGPHVRNVADARALVASCRYPPQGQRGTAFTARHGGYGLRDRNLTAARAADVMVVAQIEDAEALEAIEGIAGVPGLDSVFVGPADLAVSLGVTGVEAREAVGNALRETVAPAAASAGVALGSFAADAQEARTLAAAGCRLSAVSGTTLIAVAHIQQTETFRHASAYLASKREDSR